MANKRELKKAIHQVTAALFTECVMFKEFIPKTDVAKADELLDGILDFQRDNLTKVTSYQAKDSSVSVSAYFKSVNAVIVEDAQTLFTKINALNK
jgi:hypothetical protein